MRCTFEPRRQAAVILATFALVVAGCSSSPQDGAGSPQDGAGSTGSQPVLTAQTGTGGSFDLTFTGGVTGHVTAAASECTVINNTSHDDGWTFDLGGQKGRFKVINYPDSGGNAGTSPVEKTPAGSAFPPVAVNVLVGSASWNSMLSDSGGTITFDPSMTAGDIDATIGAFGSIGSPAPPIHVKGHFGC